MTSSNQTLILAGERAPPRSNEAAGSGAVLQRVTMMAARPDDTLVFVRADYSSGSDYAYTYSNSNAASSASAGSTGAAEPSLIADASVATSSGSGTGGTAVIPLTMSRSMLPVSSRDPYGNSRTSNRSVEQYARTQRILTDTHEPHYLDVLA